ncbi:MAG: OmpH family outer membrane protein [Treponema sp.]|nr:OmpH family outer membrane protein [Treponema sp.]MBR6297467.1 OmpH family outer membrane protein [Treponema sp.]MEE3314716.1 OmpH family outer membrane protein [Treponema sp.]
MKLKIKRFIILGVLTVLGLSTPLFAQQITKFAVVDTARVYQAFYKNSAPVRNYERKRTEFQNEIDSVTKELQTLQTRKLEYERKGDRENARATQAKITEKTNYLTEYTAAKNDELQTLKKELQNNDAFYKRLYSIIQSVAEREGYSMVLSLQQANAVLWYSPSVDLTNAVIYELGLRF